MKPIMESLPEGTIDYNRLKVIFALLEYEYGVEEESSSSNNEFQTPGTSSVPKVESPIADVSKRSVPEWMTRTSGGGIGVPQPKRSRSSNLFK